MSLHGGTAISEQAGRGEPLVSIVMPCYNGRAFICEAIESALNQSYGNVELLVVDDGSTDGSQTLVENYPVRLLQSTHQGVSAARNRGIRESRGEFFVFLDCDDRLLPGAVAAGLEALEKSPDCLMAVGAHNLIKESGEWIITRYKPQNVSDAYELLLRSNFIECTSSVLFRRAALSEHAFRDSIRGSEDYDLYLRTARLAPVCCHRNVVAEYRLHGTNSSRNSVMMLTNTLQVLSDQLRFVRNSPRHLLAYAYGWAFWRRKYGRQLTREMATVGRSCSYRLTVWWMLLKAYPLGVLIVLISRMLPHELAQGVLQNAKVQSNSVRTGLVARP